MDNSHKFRISNYGSRLGIIVDAGPMLGYGHVVRCLRLANALARHADIILYPLSECCREFLVSAATDARFEIRNSKFEINSLPPLVITDLREAHGITATIRRHRSRHISIHDLGLARAGRMSRSTAASQACFRILPTKIVLYMPDLGT